ncbi:type IV pilus modification PilV family protein [Planctomicrobium piriforme]|uniref:General secretion pathway protein I n=1 Tax=Planctomicrobium piriforme TaxID=1576369 RepID=A0A1I3IJL4_9PLAN|nr:hypothetical protein [Planctomicrobium piriforme]SFI48215.1 hypothetical protein SAMN05421753_109155 [Planctomicrobium piriforme]
MKRAADSLTRLQRNACRRGISLFEVVLALAIFIGALAAISQVLRVGSRASIRAQLNSQAAILGERRMSEILAGIVPLETVSRARFDDFPEWNWTLNVLDTETIGLLKLELTIERAGNNPDANVKYMLVRLQRDPQVYADAAAAATEVAQ